MSAVAVLDATAARAARSSPRPRAFLFLALQLMALVWSMRAFQIEERAFINLMGLATGGFLIHYWLPPRWKEPFWILLSLAGAVVIVGLLSVALLLAVGGVFFLVLSSGIPYRGKVVLSVLLGLLLMAGRALEFEAVPADFWPVLGALFMFRMMIYLYDLRQSTGGASLQEYLAYFYPLPNFYFLLFPVIDLQTLRRTVLPARHPRDRPAGFDVDGQGCLAAALVPAGLLSEAVVHARRGDFVPDTDSGDVCDISAGT